MLQIEKNKVLAEYLNINFEKLVFQERYDWHNDWNNLMKVANKLKEDTQYLPFSFTENHLSFDIETLFDNCFETVQAINKYNKQNQD